MASNYGGLPPPPAAARVAVTTWCGPDPDFPSCRYLLESKQNTNQFESASVPHTYHEPGFAASFARSLPKTLGPFRIAPVPQGFSSAACLEDPSKWRPRKDVSPALCPFSAVFRSVRSILTDLSASTAPLILSRHQQSTTLSQASDTVQCFTKRTLSSHARYHGKIGSIAANTAAERRENQRLPQLAVNGFFFRPASQPRPMNRFCEVRSSWTLETDQRGPETSRRAPSSRFP